MWSCDEAETYWGLWPKESKDAEVPFVWDSGCCYQQLARAEAYFVRMSPGQNSPVEANDVLQLCLRGVII